MHNPVHPQKWLRLAIAPVWFILVLSLHMSHRVPCHMFYYAVLLHWGLYTSGAVPWLVAEVIRISFSSVAGRVNQSFGMLHWLQWNGFYLHFLFCRYNYSIIQAEWPTSKHRLLTNHCSSPALVLLLIVMLHQHRSDTSVASFLYNWELQH